jgi:hypothetical protein
MAYKVGSSGNTGTITQYDVLVGGAASAIASVGPGSAGQVLQSAGNAANPVYSTATYPATTTANQLLYSSATNVVGGLALPAVPGSQVIYDVTNVSYFNPLQEAVYFDDFLGFFQGSDMVTTLGWYDHSLNSGTLVYNTSSLMDNGHPGMAIFGTGANTNGGYALCLGKGGTVDSFLLGGGVYDFYFVVKVPVLSSAGQRYTIYVGLADDVGGATNEEMWFTYSDNVNSGDWVGQTRTGGGAITSVNSSVAVGTSWTTLRINVNANASTITFYINGTSIGTSTTNIPANAVSPILQIIKSAGTTPTTMYVDLFYAFVKLTSAR